MIINFENNTESGFRLTQAKFMAAPLMVITVLSYKMTEVTLGPRANLPFFHLMEYLAEGISAKV